MLEWYSVIDFLIVTASISKLLHSWLFIDPSEHHYTTQTSKFNKFLNRSSTMLTNVFNKTALNIDKAPVALNWRYACTRISKCAAHSNNDCALTEILHLSQSTRMHLSCASTTNNEAHEDAFTLDAEKAPHINEYWLPLVVTKGACQSCTLQSSVITVYLCPKITSPHGAVST